ncbi:DUF192 domain-containing protein [Arenibacter sp. GZD96]|uniref:DUF192 domain-containing protein n=1 Tax=Aurantibrevibacter litoralis TaxID=3106030 RepID=UPI002AFDFDC1|nr:DUF192 domain-containing protein [Arenibacter sp. GZD-96]MEA1785115.1 DUF192 domain-containing protein [Arenibacter sp. GZD-96]
MNRFKFLSGFFLILSFVVPYTACKEAKNSTIETVKPVFVKEGQLSIFTPTTDSLVVELAIEFAETEYETQTGLMYRDALKEYEGMLFVFSESALHSFYMKNTQIPLDILFIDENFEIVSIHENAEPFNETGISSKVPVRYVLEINAGLTQKWGISVGDRIAIQK